MLVDGFRADLFNFSPGPLMVLMSCVAIVYGLSTDYEVFLRLSRRPEPGGAVDEGDRAARRRPAVVTAAAAIGVRLRRFRFINGDDEVHRLRHDRRPGHRRDNPSACCWCPPHGAAARGLLVGPDLVTRISEKIGHNERLEGVGRLGPPPHPAAAGTRARVRRSTPRFFRVLGGRKCRRKLGSGRPRGRTGPLRRAHGATGTQPTQRQESAR
ncbi:hypothetical protein CVAR21S_01573 [Corynebacterium variabile]